MKWDPPVDADGVRIGVLTPQHHRKLGQYLRRVLLADPVGTPMWRARVDAVPAAAVALVGEEYPAGNGFRYRQPVHW